MEPVYKVCRTCGNEFEETTKNFSTKGTGRFSPDCIDCQNAVRRQKRAANPEKFREAENAAYQNKHDHILQHRAQKRREKGIPEAHRVDPNDTRNSHQRFFDNNPGAYERDLEKRRIKKTQKRREAGIQPKRVGKMEGEELRTAQRAYSKKWRSNNPEKVKTRNIANAECRRRYRKTHPEKQAEMNARRYAQTHGISADLVDYTLILIRDNNFCYICQKPIQTGQEINFDHVQPLSRGGKHLFDNIKVTHGICNRRKSDKLITELTDFDRSGP